MLQVMLREVGGRMEVAFLDMVRSVESEQNLQWFFNMRLKLMVFVYICLRCQIFTRLIAITSSLELLMKMELVAELATLASHLWSTKAGKAARSNHWSRFRCLIRPHAGVTIGSVKGKKRDLQQCRKCPEGASICNATAIQMSPGCLASNGMHWMHHVAPPTSMAFWCKICVPRIDGRSIRHQPPLPLSQPFGLPGWAAVGQWIHANVY